MTVDGEERRGKGDGQNSVVFLTRAISSAERVLPES